MKEETFVERRNRRARERFAAWPEEKKAARRARNKAYRDSLSPEEKARVSERQSAYYYANRERIKEKQAANYSEKKRAYNKEYAKNNRARLRYMRRHSMYGLKEGDIERMFDEQKGLCAICDRALVPFDRLTHIDHCHTTGKVRGILCYRCNRRLEPLEDKIFHQRATEYLDKHRIAEQ